MTIDVNTMNLWLARLGEGLAGAHEDPRGLFDEAQAMIAALTREGLSVPDELREAADALEAQIIEDFYDNMPI